MSSDLFSFAAPHLIAFSVGAALGIAFVKAFAETGELPSAIATPTPGTAGEGGE